MAQLTLQSEIFGKTLSLETGRIAKQAGGAVIARLGDTMVLATACKGRETEKADFFPLSVDFVAKTYAAGRIPGGFFKREGKLSEQEILSSRLIDRTIRPLFPKGYHNEVQIIATVISADEKYNPDVLGLTAASCALSLSPLPFAEPVAGVRVSLVDNNLIVLPTLEEVDNGTLDIVVAGSESSIMMIEGNAWEIKEDKIIEAIMLAHQEIKKLVAIQREMQQKCGVKPVVFTPPQPNTEIADAVRALVKDKIHDISFHGIKQERYAGVDNLLAETKAALAEKYPEAEDAISDAFHKLEKEDMRNSILDKGIRIGGRDLDTIRPITCELDILPRAHGSALFTRGETQALVVTTLGTKLDEQRVDSLQGEYHKSYMLHYNFPPFSVGEVKRLGSTGRREVGHGHLAEVALAPILPAEASFPYTVRIVSEITESNGSSSMASVCGGSLSLMASGVPIKAPVAGVAMGLITDGKRIAILTDILGTEDHIGDMDFKVTGTRDGITAIQMDIKIHGITNEILKNALDKANIARCKIIDTMEQTIAKPRKELSPFAPRITIIQIDKEKIREVIGQGGKVIREIQEMSGTKIDISDDGAVQIAASNLTQRDEAIKRIKAIVAEPELGAVYNAVVKSTVEFGAFVEYLPGREGLVHISELDMKRVERTTDIVKVGDTVRVKLVGFDRNGKVRLSRKAMLLEPQAPAAPEAEAAAELPPA